MKKKTQRADRFDRITPNIYVHQDDPTIAGRADDFQACLKMASGAFIAVRIDL